MLLAGWSTEMETAAHQESSVCMLEAQILLSLKKHYQKDEYLMSKLNPYPHPVSSSIPDVW